MNATQHFDSLFRQYYTPLCLFAHRYVTDMDDCHDLVSTAFEEVWRNRATLNEATARQYLYASVRNRCIDFLRQQGKREAYLRYIKLTSSDEAQPADTMEQQDEARLVERAVATLGSPTREILHACYVEGHKYADVAKLMGISIATVKKHMVRALRQLREYKKMPKP